MDLLKSADSALYIAKDAGRNTTTLYTPSVHHSVLEKRALSVEIERGIEAGEFIAYFQPQFDAQSEVLIGIEALARWQHPTRGVVAPDVFLPIAEQLRMVQTIDDKIFAHGLESVAKLNAEGLFVPRIAFNVGFDQIINTDLPSILKCHDIGYSRVALEILESVLVEDQDGTFIDQVQNLRFRGIGIEVDDFGSGHASVIALQRLKPDLMKLDRELVRPIDTSKTARVLIKSMIEMGHALGIDVLAEGVETAEQAAILKDLGCDAFQGFYFAKPMAFDDLRAFARAAFDPKRQRVTSGVKRLDMQP